MGRERETDTLLLTTVQRREEMNGGGEEGIKSESMQSKTEKRNDRTDEWLCELLLMTVRRREEMQSKTEKWKDRTEEWLCDAAMRGDVESLEEIMKIDEYILDKVLVGSFKGKNPLHIATSTGREEFVRELLKYRKDLAKVVDEELGTALHIASSKGHLEIVKHLVEVSPEMCVARDREGNNPLHIAAMNGNDKVLKVLLRTNPCATRLMVDRGDNILHLCVNYSQLASLKLLLDVVGEEFANSTDVNGNNILHLAVFGKRCEIIKYLLKWLKEKKEIDVNARNGCGWTALDIHSRVAESEDEKSEYHGMGDVLREFGVEKSDKLFFPFDPYWQKKKNGTLLIVSSLMATILFQVGITPPGGVWVDSSPGHEAGKAIIAYTNPKAYSYFMFFNTVGFLLCLTTVLELIVVLPSRKRDSGFIRAGISWSTIMIIAFAYTFSVIVVTPTPTEMYKSVNFFVLATVIVWAVGITSLRVLPYQVQLILLGLPIILPVFLGACFYKIAKEISRTEPIESTVQSTGDTALPPKPTAPSQNETRVSIPE